MTLRHRDSRSTWEWLARARATVPLGSLRWLLSLAAALTCAAVVGLAVVLPGGRSAFQAGPVSSAHALFQNDCATCHREPFQTFRRLAPGSHARSVPDAACVQCHPVGGHHADKATAPACAECHREHRGRAVLARATDAACLRCHGKSKGSCCGGGEGVSPEKLVTGFPTGHPPFAARPDPGRMRFSHAAHLGIAGVRGSDRRLVHLDCTDCHRADETGRYMRPVKYADHCASCHPLSVQLAGHAGDGSLRTAWERFAKEPAPHVAPGQVRALLRDRLEGFVRDNPLSVTPLSRGQPWPPRPTIAETVWRSAHVAPDAALRRTFVEGQLTQVETMLFDSAGGCAYCHLPKGEAKRTSVVALPEYAPTSLPDRWLGQSRFRHDSHRMVGCAGCHTATVSRTTSDVLIPEIEVCARCHNSRAGVRHDCAWCHVYHERGGPRRNPNIR